LGLRGTMARQQTVHPTWPSSGCWAASTCRCTKYLASQRWMAWPMKRWWCLVAIPRPARMPACGWI